MFRIIRFFFFIAFISCQNDPNEKTKSKKANEIYFYEPSLSTITGIVFKYPEYGPPGYGETPTIDSKDTIYILQLSDKINVFPLDGINDKINDSTFNVDKLQLTGLSKIHLEKYVGNRTTINGNLFHGISGHHYTDILISIKEIK